MFQKSSGYGKIRYPDSFFLLWRLILRKTRSVPNTSQEQSNSQGQTLFQIQFLQNFFFSKVELVSRLPPLRYRFGLLDPPKAVASRSVRCLNHTLQPAFQTGELILSNSPRQNTTKNKLVRIEISRSVPVSCFKLECQCTFCLHEPRVFLMLR